jgi:hypothetical protein
MVLFWESPETRILRAIITYGNMHSTKAHLLTTRGSFLLLGITFLLQASLFAQDPAIPAVYSNLEAVTGELTFTFQDTLQFRERPREARFTLTEVIGNPQGTKEGLRFDFGPHFQGTLYYGFIPQGDSKHPHPVYFRSPAPIDTGLAVINVAEQLSGVYDMVGWEQNGFGTMGYRVVDTTGLLLYDGVVSFYHRQDSFLIAPSIIEGPFINKLRPDGATISFTTNGAHPAEVRIGDRSYTDTQVTQRHEIEVDSLDPDTDYTYSVFIADTLGVYSLRTAPEPGSRQPFCFAYCSDSRSGQGGGERNVYGANFYILKKIMALAAQQRTAFVQFTGDLINGYVTESADIELQYANWKRAVQPFWHHLPIYAAMGNHESLMREFYYAGGDARLRIDRFPFATESSEAVFARNFVNPENGPLSEDGTIYDPDSTKMDFPSYRENVFYYTYDNVAMIVLNSDYFYAPTTSLVRLSSGNIHGFIMDAQLAWLEETVRKLEQDSTIDHLFVTQHTPWFPNGGHVRDDMWYDGNNQMRPYIAGQPYKQGIIERRDQMLDIMVNNSSKVRALLTGDEHNYNRLHLTPATEIYPELYFFPKIELTRSIYQINNGAAGAPYYAQEQTPWTPWVSSFTTQNALVFFHVDGDRIEVEVLNPDTLEEVDRFKLH